MKKIIVYILFCLCLAVSVFAACGGTMLGDGSQGNPCNVTNCSELANITLNKGMNYQLVNNIDCSESWTWNSGAGFPPITDFVGNFTGNWFNISYVYINKTTSGAGIFYTSSVLTKRYVFMSNVRLNHFFINCTAASAECGAFMGGSYFTNISNIYLNNITIYAAGELVGGLCGRCKSNISNISIINSKISSTSKTVGGLMGYAYADYFNNLSANNITVIGPNGVGGLFGSIQHGTALHNIINNSYVLNSNISSLGYDTNGDAVGGIVGNVVKFNLDNLVVRNTNLNGNYVGGIIGVVYFSAVSWKNYLLNSYISNVNITCSNLTTCNLGGLISKVGLLSSTLAETEVTNCYVNAILNSSTTLMTSNGIGCFIGLTTSDKFNMTISNTFSICDIYYINATNVGQYIGNLNDTIRSFFAINNSYFLNNSALASIGAGITNYTELTPITDKTIFYSKTNAPLSSWDFNTVWQENAGSYPTLIGEPKEAGPACTANVTNTSWTSWLNISCVGNYMNQTRNLTQYDANSCGTITNTSFIEQRATEPCIFRYDSIMMPAFTEMANLFSLLIMIAIMSIIIVIIAAMFGHTVPNVDMYKMVLIIVISAMLLAIGIVVISQLGI